jgi:lantibiotic modifying enzyme
MPTGTGWKTPHQQRPLGGFSHGCAGIALSLLKLADISGEERFRRMARAAFAYDSSLFVPSQQNWADLRVHILEPAAPDEQRQECMVAWCHGAAGIGLARLEALALLDDVRMRDEIDIALNTTMEQGLVGNHSLCHGALGNVEVLLTAARLLSRSEDRARLERAIAIVLESLKAYGWVTGVPLGVETPGLMTGLAGIGYELLRLAEPDRVPSVLSFAPPMI